MTRQYFQQPNQVRVTLEDRNFMNQYRTGLVFGTTVGYPCCTANMHQGWPKFVQNLWYATADNGLAALVYGASEVKAKVGSGRDVSIVEQTDYPFKDKIKFAINTQSRIKFPLHVRIPLWCKNPLISVNGKTIDIDAKNNIVIINREWSNGDNVELSLPMEIRYSRWAQNSLGIERGPLVYALKIEEEWRDVTQIVYRYQGVDYYEKFWEILPKSDWNYALIKKEVDKQNFKIEVKDKIPDYPWNLANAPITMTTVASRLPLWVIERGSAGKIPASPGIKVSANIQDLSKDGIKEITLIPYGCTKLRISQFPVH